MQEVQAHLFLAGKLFGDFKLQHYGLNKRITLGGGSSGSCSAGAGSPESAAQLEAAIFPLYGCLVPGIVHAFKIN